MLYRSPGSDPLRRTVRPYHLVNYRGEWYLIGHCLLRDSVLIFAVSRILEARMTGAPFAMPPDFDFRTYMGPHFGIMRDRDERKVSVWFAPEQAPYIRERTWHDTQEIVDGEDGSLVITFSTGSLLEVKRWVLSFGSLARVIEPEILANEIRDEIQAMKKLYG